MSRPIELILSRLEKVSGKKGGGRFTALCPVHADHSPSLSISEGDDGRVLLHCFSGCSAEAIVSSIKLTMTELFCADTDSKRPPLVPGVSRRELRTAIELKKRFYSLPKQIKPKADTYRPTTCNEHSLHYNASQKPKGFYE